MPTQVIVPSLGESVTQAILVKWFKANGDSVAQDEPICELETDKANVPLNSSAVGMITRLKNEGDTVNVGEAVASIGEGSGNGNPQAVKAAASVAASTGGKAAVAVAEPPVTPKTATVVLDDLSPAVRKLVEENRLDPRNIKASGPGGRLTKEDVLNHLEVKLPGEARRMESQQNMTPVKIEPTKVEPVKTPVALSPNPLQPVSAGKFDAAGIRREPMSKIRKRIAQTLVIAQQTAAILTTFNEVDLTAIQELRAKYKERFTEIHGIGLGLMSFFAKAAVQALKEFPNVNAFIEGEDVVYHNYVHLGIAVSTERGLTVPVLRNAQNLSFAKIESEIKRLAAAVRDGKLGIEELTGGTFTITNGGIYGSLLSTPILNPPQSGILGMHAIQKRPMAVGDKIEIRPMMYIALSYDHRLVDGRDSVSFLVRMKQLLEDPARLMLEI